MRRIYITTFDTGLSAFFMVKSVAVDVISCEGMHVLLDTQEVFTYR